MPDCSLIFKPRPPRSRLMELGAGIGKCQGARYSICWQSSLRYAWLGLLGLALENRRVRLRSCSGPVPCPCVILPSTPVLPLRARGSILRGFLYLLFLLFGCKLRPVAALRDASTIECELPRRDSQARAAAIFQNCQSSSSQAQERVRVRL